MTYRKKLIEVALPLEAINEASAREKSIRHGHPSTLHLWWARRPLAACRAVIFASLVDDPDDPAAPPEFVAACRRLPRGKNAAANDTPRQRLFDFIETLVQWESTTDEGVLATARELIRLATNGNPPPLLDPFAGGGSIPLEAQRLGLEAHASDLNPVAVMINKALIEIPPKFANRPPVNPRDRKGTAGTGGWKGAAGLAADVRYYGEWMRDRAWERIGHLYPKYDPHPPAPSPIKREGESGGGEETWEKWEISPALERKMRDVARELRKNPTPSEEILWQAIRKRQMDGRKFRRQMAIGPFVVDFYCASERLVVEVDGPIHETQRQVDKARQELIESLGIRFVRVTAAEVEQNLPHALNAIRAAFLPSPLSGGRAGDGGQSGETVIAWLWARTVKCPNPACGAQMPLVSSFELSKKQGRQSWVEPKIDRQARMVYFNVQSGKGTPPDPPKLGRGANFRCLVCGETASDPYIKAEGRANRMGAELMAVVTESPNGRNYYAPTVEQQQMAAKVRPEWVPRGELPDNPRWFSPPLFGMTDYEDLFTPRQLVTLTTFSDLVAEVRRQIQTDAIVAGLPDDEVSLSEAGVGAKAYAEAVSVYLATVVSKASVASNSFARWRPGESKTAPAFGRQAIAMVWDFAETNPFAGAGGDFLGIAQGTANAIEKLPATQSGHVQQLDAASQLMFVDKVVISTDPPYYDNIGYADLSDFSYVWLRPMLKLVYPHIFSTLLVPKEEELVAIPHRFNGDKGAADKHFEEGLMRTFTNIRGITPSGYPLTVYYAFRQSEITEEEGTASTGWETMLNGLLETGFGVVGTWPIRTEGSGRLVAAGTNALASSIVLVCRPRPENAPITSRREFVNTLRRELPAALREMQSGNIAPVDLAQASIGPGMAVYSRYSKVLEPNGDRLSVRTALQLINQALDEYLAEQEGEMDEDSRFAVAWFEQFGFKNGVFGQADVLARAKNTSVDGLANAGILESGGGKVRLYAWAELDPGWDPAEDHRLTTWEATHHLIERLNTYGEEGAAQLLARLPSELAAEARQLAYRLYSICERKGWAEHARDYNDLVVSWGASQERAAGLREQYQQGRLFGE